jgi:hypothetical protein
MVSIDERITVEGSIRQSSKANAFLSFLQGVNVTPEKGELNEVEKTYYSLLDSLFKNNSLKFRQEYDELSKRKVVEEQPIIYDNFLLFVLVIGVIKFETSSEWLKSVIKLRTTQNEPEKLITSSFINLLDNNIHTTDGIPSIILAALAKAEKQEVALSVIRNSFEANNKVGMFLKKDLFLACIYLYTSHYIISVSIDDRIVKLKAFELTFNKRVKLLQNIIYFLILVFIVAVWFYLIRRYPKVKELANDLGILLQIIGIGLLALGLTKAKDFFGKFIKIFFGYRE